MKLYKCSKIIFLPIFRKITNSLITTQKETKDDSDWGSDFEDTSSTPEIHRKLQSVNLKPTCSPKPKITSPKPKLLPKLQVLNNSTDKVCFTLSLVLCALCSFCFVCS